MWQKCPVCNGLGTVPNFTLTANTTCPTCNGARIISEVNGLPPAIPLNTSSTSSTGDFRDNVESQDEYYGRVNKHK